MSYFLLFKHEYIFSDVPEDQDDSLMWENLAPMVEHSRFPILNDNDLALLLEQARPDFAEIDEPKLEFPKLSKNQRKFGVNPAFQPEQPLPGDDLMESFNEQQTANGEFVVIIIFCWLSGLIFNHFFSFALVLIPSFLWGDWDSNSRLNSSLRILERLTARPSTLPEFVIICLDSNPRPLGCKSSP